MGTVDAGNPRLGKPANEFMKPSEILSSPDKWCRGVMARDKDGKSVLPDSPEATSWCLLGLFYRDCGADFKANIVVRNKIREMLPDKRLIKWNDEPGRTFEEVRVVILKAEAE